MKILSENERRLAAINAEYDPLKKYADNKEKADNAGNREAENGESELCRCREDFPYWAAKYVYIKPKGGGEDIPFVLNPPQRRLVATFEEMRLAGKPIRLILLKARQWGGSTCVQLYMAWLQLVHQTGLNSLIIAHYSGASSEIKDMFDRMLASYPDRLLFSEESQEKKGEKRVERVGNSGTLFRVIPRNCKIKVCTAETPTSARGGDYSLVHCSEVGLWKSTVRKTPEDIIRSACSGVLLKPLTMIVMESTANGTGTYFHSEYEAAKRGEGQFKPLFIPWFEIPHYSIPFSSREEEEKFARELYENRENDTVDSDRKQPWSYLWRLWEKGATLQAINWYIEERKKYSDHAQMAAEYPSDDIEAFAHSGAKVFDPYKIEALRKGCIAPIDTGEIVGAAPSGPESLNRVRFVADTHGSLQIWQHPDRDPVEMVTDRYLVVVDVGGRSLRSDWSVIAVFDRERQRCEGEGPEIVAQWRGHADIDLLAWNAARIATYYDDALLVIESNTIETRDTSMMTEADQTPFIFTQLRNHYRNLYCRKSTPADIRQGVPVKYGFHTNTATKPMIITTLISVIREGLYVERDERCLSEYLAYEQRQNGSYGALPGHHDDILMTRAIGIHISLYEMRRPELIDRQPESSGSYYDDRPYWSAACF